MASVKFSSLYNLKNFSRMDAEMTETMSLSDCIESALNIGRDVLKHKVELFKGEPRRIACAR